MLRPSFTQEDVRRMIEAKVRAIDRVVIGQLQVLGEKCVSQARQALYIDPSAFPINYRQPSKPLQQREFKPREIKGFTRRGITPQKPKFGDYLDQSQNLKNSIGYVIYAQGIQVRENFDSGPGASKGKTLANDVAKRHRSGYVLVVVAI